MFYRAVKAGECVVITVMNGLKLGTRCFNPFPNKSWFLCVCSKGLLKTLWEKKKLLVTSNFSFPNKSWFLCVCSKGLLKTLWEKKKLLVTSNFSFSHGVFYPFGELSAIYIKFEIVVCKLFQFESVKSLPFGKGLSLYQTLNWSKLK